MKSSIDFEKQFRAVFEEEWDRLCRYLERFVGDSSSADDIAQEALVRLYRRGKMPDNPAAWLLSVARNVARNHRRDLRRRVEILWLRPPGQDAVESEDDPQTRLERREIRVRVRRALDSLSERDRQVLLMSVSGYRYREIASALGLAEGSVGTTLRRAMLRLKDLVAETS